MFMKGISAPYNNCGFGQKLQLHFFKLHVILIFQEFLLTYTDQGLDQVLTLISYLLSNQSSANTPIERFRDTDRYTLCESHVSNLHSNENIQTIPVTSTDASSDLHKKFSVSQKVYKWILFWQT